VKDREHRFVTVNKAFCEFYNIGYHDVIGKTDADIFPPNEWEVYRERDRKIFATGEPDENEEYTTLPGGKRLSVLTRKSLLQTSDGNKYVLGIITDMTDFNSVIEKLKDSDTLHKALFNNTPNLILMHHGFVISMVNQATLNFFKIEREYIEGKKIDFFFKIKEGSMELGMMNASTSDRTANLYCPEVEAIDSKGHPAYFLARSEIVKHEGREVVMSVFTNITERRKIENLTLYQAFAAEENERRQFAADLHDDLGPILSTIKLHLGMLQKTREPARYPEALETLENLLDDVIAKVHSISHQITPHLITDFGLEASLRDLSHILAINEDFRINLQSDLGDLRFAREAELHLYRIISELINNSIKHAHAREVFLDLSHHEKLLRIRYYDDGPGYDIDQVIMSSKGIGISNIFQRVRLLKGEIHFSKENNRTEVTIQVLLR
jgi:PAS domain S-box-containing protein